MPTFLSDPSYLHFGLLGLVVIVPLAVVFLLPAPPAASKQKPTRKQICFIVSAIGLVLLLALVACDYAFESDREQIVRKLNEMSDAVRERNLDRGFQHISESFRIGIADKKALRSLADSAQRAGQVDEILIWDEKLDSLDLAAKKAVVSFRFKVRGSISRGEYYRGKAYFGHDPDGQWRLQRFEIFKPEFESDSPMPIPGLPQ